jgi:periplasmic protein TonB
MSRAVRTVPACRIARLAGDNTMCIRHLPILRGLVLLSLIGLSACNEQAGTTDPAAPASAAAAAPTARPANTAAASESTAALMRRANEAFLADRIATPPGDNAIELFLAVREREPAYHGLNEVLVEVMPLANMAFESALKARDAAEAERLLDLMQRVNAESQVTKIAAGNLQKMQLADAAQRQAEAALLAASAAPASVEPPASPSATEVAARQPAARNTAPAKVAPSRNEPVAAASAPVPTKAADIPPTANPAARKTNLTAPIAISKVAPEYPAQARRRKAAGFVELEFLVSTNGIAEDIRVVRSEPEGLFDRSAVRAVMRWKFKPAERDGKPEVARTRTMMNFQQG